ncbi:hypothetical protein SUGI_0129530 [Cryptomeria japonica]|nr:hypothetical protein SUGI_0129530 [Cryptomeria japonica]
MFKYVRIWHKFSIIGRGNGKGRSRWVPADVPQGHLAVYVGGYETKQRFIIPATYVNHPLIRALLDKAEEEFGMNENGPIFLPCHPLIFDRYIMLLIRTNVGLSRWQIEQVLNRCCYLYSSDQSSCTFCSKSIPMFKLNTTK